MEATVLCHLILYADDPALFVSGRNVGLIEERLGNELLIEERLGNELSPSVDGWSIIGSPSI